MPIRGKAMGKAVSASPARGGGGGGGGASRQMDYDSDDSVAAELAALYSSPRKKKTPQAKKASASQRSASQKSSQATATPLSQKASQRSSSQARPSSQKTPKKQSSQKEKASQKSPKVGTPSQQKATPSQQRTPSKSSQKEKAASTPAASAKKSASKKASAKKGKASPKKVQMQPATFHVKCTASGSVQILAPGLHGPLDQSGKRCLAASVVKRGLSHLFLFLASAFDSLDVLDESLLEECATHAVAITIPDDMRYATPTGTPAAKRRRTSHSEAGFTDDLVEALPYYVKTLFPTVCRQVVDLPPTRTASAKKARQSRTPKPSTEKAEKAGYSPVTPKNLMNNGFDDDDEPEVEPVRSRGTKRARVSDSPSQGEAASQAAAEAAAAAVAAAAASEKALLIAQRQEEMKQDLEALMHKQKEDRMRLDEDRERIDEDRRRIDEMVAERFAEKAAREQKVRAAKVARRTDERFVADTKRYPHGVRLRSQPLEKSRKVARKDREGQPLCLRRNEEMTCVEEKEGFTRVVTRGGAAGWVRTRHLVQIPKVREGGHPPSPPPGHAGSNDGREMMAPKTEAMEEDELSPSAASNE